MRECLTCKGWLRCNTDPIVGLCAWVPDDLRNGGMPEWRFQHEFCRGWVFGEKRAAYRITPNGSCKPAIEGREYIGKSLTEERLRRGWSLQELADFLGVARSTVLRWETNQSPPNRSLSSLVDSFIDGRI